MEEDEIFDMSGVGDAGGEDPQWRDLDVNERKELMHNVFSDESWYDGQPSFKQGDTNPPYEEIATRVGAPTKEVKRYYAAWLTGRGIDAQAAMRGPEPAIPPSVVQPPSMQGQQQMASPPASVGGGGSASGMVKNQMMGDITSSLFSQQGGGGGSSDMEWMMKMMMLQQIMQTEGAQFNSSLAMQQQNAAAQRDSEYRREQQARMDSANTRQENLVMTLLKDGRREDEFTTVIKGAAMERIADGLFGGSGESTAERIISRVLDPKAIGAAFGAAKSAMGGMGKQVPAGYDIPSYNPYAQPMTIEHPLVSEPPVPTEIQKGVEPQPQPPSDNFYGDETPPPPPQPEQPEIPQEPSSDEYERALLDSFHSLMGAALEDEKTLTALQEQISISVQNVQTKNHDLLPEAKLDLMSKELVLIRALRDIGLGLREARERIEGGTDEELVLDFIKGELTKQPVFEEIFSQNSYEELLGKIEPYKHTGGIIHDYQFLLEPGNADMCRKVIQSMQGA